MKQLLLLFTLLVFQTIISAQNTPPTITGQSRVGSYGQTICLDFITSDADGDTVIILKKQLMPKAVFTHTNKAKKFSSASVCVTPNRTDHQDTVPYGIILLATDGKDTVSITRTITIPPTPHNVHPVITKLNFNTFKVEVKGDKNEPWHRYKGLTISSRIYDSANKLITTVYDSVFTFTTPAYQKYKLFVYYNASSHLYASLDTLYPDLNAGINVLENDLFAVFPNPANNFINISGTNQTATKITIHDITGRLVKTITQNLESISVTELKEGVYTLIFIDDKEVAISTNRLVINR